MNIERLMKIIVAPHTSEKATRLADKERQFVFRVLRDATKKEIKEAVELLFKVKVGGVQVCNVKGKRKVFKQTVGYRQDWKKAYVTLTEGDIQFAGAEK